MHRFARPTAALTGTLAATGLLVAACGTVDTNNHPVRRSTTQTLGATVRPGYTEPRDMPTTLPETSDMPGSSVATVPHDPAVTRTEIPTPGGTILVADHILARYAELGGPDGTLGKPAEPAFAGPDGGACQAFTGGTVCWSERTSTHVVWGDIRTAWEATGGADGALGYPTGDEQDVSTGKQSEFAGGTIAWAADSHRTTVTRR